MTAPPSRPRTRGVVLDLVRAAGTISRVELAQGSGLTAATITHVVRELMVDGLLIEVGQGESTGGKRRTLIELNSGSRYTVGVQLDRSTSSIVVVDLAGRPVIRSSIGGAGNRSPAATLEAIAAEVDSLLVRAGVDRGSVLGVGLVTHGPQDRAAGVLLNPQPTPEWYGYPLVATLSKMLDLPVLLDNDASAAAIGEYWVGGVDPASTHGCIYMAGGIGGGVVVEGELYRGGTSNPVEIGHISLDAGGIECSCGNRGCLENFAGPLAVIQAARAVPGLPDRIGLTEAAQDILVDFDKVASAAIAGDADALAIIEHSARYLGIAALNFANLFDLDLVVLAGPTFGTAGPIYQPIIHAALQRGAFNRPVRPVRAVLSASGADAAAVGGAVLVLRSELTPLQRLRPDGRSLTYQHW
ncbi:putative NBD/HSP70 family sugar kinase [Nakamurella sp. UYEF19]|uniref:ROK family protein n=1 Tax=Nakamurella sp. UYEF19 TaxID=1756392 RepID=UPI003390B644